MLDRATVRTGSLPEYGALRGLHQPEGIRAAGDRRSSATSERAACALPGLATWDVGVFKNIPIHESWRIQFRAEFFNVLNRVNYKAPDQTNQTNNVSAGGFGSIRASERSPDRATGVEDSVLKPDRMQRLTTRDWAPLSETERYRSIDVLRGLSLFGVLLVNLLTFFRISLFEYFLTRDSGPGWLNRAVDVSVTTLLEFKAFDRFRSPSESVSRFKWSGPC